MDNQENNYLENEYSENNDRPEETQQEQTMPPYQDAPSEEEQQSSQPQYYSNAGVGRKESPFADSPYVMNHQNQNRYQYAPDASPKKQKKEKKKGGRKVWKGILAAVLAIALVGGTCAVAIAATNSSWSKKTAAMNAAYEEKLEELEERVAKAEAQAKAAMAGQNMPNADNTDVSNTMSSGLTPSQVYAMNVNSVVAISNQATTNVYGQITETASSGSGFIISEDGYVVSNYHVVEGATTLTVITYDGTEYPAELIGYEASNDVALLKVDATGLDPVVFGSSDELIVGDQVVAIGNPLGELTSTLTVGYISAKDRTINTDGTYSINMMQTDAAINSGNSGGPLFNSNGQVIGITTAKYSGSSNSGATIEGIGFAIPIDDVLDIVSDLQQYGYVTGAYLGISVVSMDASVAEAWSLPTGSRVASVEEGSCAQKAGVQTNDIITGIGKYTVTGNSDLLSALRKFDAGDTTVLKIFRGGAELELTITLDAKPAPVEEPEVPATEVPQQTDPSAGGEMPSEGDAEEWFNFYAPFFGFGGR